MGVMHGLENIRKLSTYTACKSSIVLQLTHILQRNKPSGSHTQVMLIINKNI